MLYLTITHASKFPVISMSILKNYYHYKVGEKLYLQKYTAKVLLLNDQISKCLTFRTWLLLQHYKI